MNIILMVAGGLLFLWIAIAVIAHFHSRTDKYRIVTFFRMYKNLKRQSGETDEEILIIDVLNKYNKELFQNGMLDHSIAEFDGSENGMKSFVWELLTAEDIICFKLEKDVVDKKKQIRLGLINEAYKKMFR